MNLQDARVLLTGATGGIGAATAVALLEQGASVLLTGRDAASLQALADSLKADAARVAILPADLTSNADRARLCKAASTWKGGVNVLINNAGVGQFALLQHGAAEDAQRVFASNVIAPIELCRQLLPHLLRQPYAHILNVGSVFGTIGYPGYTVYCGTKFALRGFTEALRRELSNSRVRVHYLAPRATRTKINSSAVQRLNARLGTAVDEPDCVARAALKMLRTESIAQVIGWPEKLFARLNALMPWLVDSALAKQLPIIQAHAGPNARSSS